MVTRRLFIVSLLIFGLGLSFSALVVDAQNGKPLYAGYKGVSIGMPAADCRAKLGQPKDQSDTQDFFIISDNESAQIYYDSQKKVSLVSVNYLGKLDAVPMPKDVFGEDAEAKPDGSIFKMVRYPKAGYWVSYNRTAGSDPMIIITMQKMPGAQ
jgi:hypothetical protein